MKVRVFKVMLAKGWARMLYTVSLLLLPAILSAQEIETRRVRLMYGVPMPMEDTVTLVAPKKDTVPATQVIPGVEEMDRRLQGRTVVYGPPTVNSDARPLKPRQIRWIKFKNRIRLLFGK